MIELDIEKYFNLLEKSTLTRNIGRVTEVRGIVLKGYLPEAVLGGICEVDVGPHSKFLCEVVGFEEKEVILMPLGEMKGVGRGSKLLNVHTSAKVKVGPHLLGRVLDGLGEPIDDLGPIESNDQISLYRDIINPMKRKPIIEPLDLGIKAINGILSVGRGQRMGIIAGSGVGKSVLLGMMARYTNADVNVIALIGERGREVRDFIENDLGPEGLKKSVVIVSTSDKNPLVRMRGAFLAAAISEYFAFRGQNVLFLMDSVTRFAMAQREIGLSIGEPPASKGYTPSVFSLLPKLLERAGSFEMGGSITGFYTVLVEGDDLDDPIGDSVRSIVDGHIVLSRELSQKGHYPSIDILNSNSRVMRSVVNKEHIELAQRARELLATYHNAEDLINIGAYKEGSNPKIDESIQFNNAIVQFLKQEVESKCDFNQCILEMQKIFQTH